MLQVAAGLRRTETAACVDLTSTRQAALRSGGSGAPKSRPIGPTTRARHRGHRPMHQRQHRPHQVAATATRHHQTTRHQTTSKVRCATTTRPPPPRSRGMKCQLSTSHQQSAEAAQEPTPTGQLASTSGSVHLTSQSTRANTHGLKRTAQRQRFRFRFRFVFYSKANKPAPAPPPRARVRAPPPPPSARIKQHHAAPASPITSLVSSSSCCPICLHFAWEQEQAGVGVHVSVVYARARVVGGS